MDMPRPRRGRCRRRSGSPARFRPSPNMRSSPTARRTAWWRPAGAWSGCACRVQTALAFSRRSSTAAPATSGSAPPGSACRPGAATCRARSSSRPPGGRAPAGSSSATRCASAPGTTASAGRARTAGRRPTTRPSTSCCAPPSAWWAASSSASTASRRSTTAATRRNGSTRARATAKRSRPGATATSRCAWSLTCASVSKAPARTPPPRCARASALTQRWRGRARSTRQARSSGPSIRRRRTWTRRSSASSAPPTSGASGSTTASSPSTHGRATCSAAR